MMTPTRDVSALFRQLGLDSSEQAMDDFMSRHAVPLGQSLCDAPFWSASQAQFLREAIQADADWTQAVDELAARLAQRALFDS